MRNNTFIPAHIQAADLEAAAAAQSEAEIKNAIKRHMARMAMYTDWVKQENIDARLEAAKKSAAEALERGKEMGRNLELLPVPDPLPDYMKGQAPSTIQSMLRNNWKPEPK